MKAISLFSGMGGDALGMRQASLDVVAYSEIEKVFRQTHELNFHGCGRIGNGNILQTPDSEFERFCGEVDMIFAGFPCQGFSQAGKKLPDDPRNTLFREFLRATKLVKPKYIIGENVKGLLNRKNADGALFIDIIKAEFRTLGYDIYTKVLKASKYGIPQNRERLFIVGIMSSINQPQPFTFPDETSIPNQLDLRDIVRFTMEGALKVTPPDFDFATVPDECILKDMDNDETEQTTPEMKPHPNLISLARNRNYVYKEKTYPLRLHFGKRIPVGGEVIDLRKPLNTVICTYARQPRFFVPQQNKNGYYLRALLPDELKQIQGFPADYQLSGNKSQQIVQIGNAVPPPLVKKIIEQIIG